MPAIYLAENWPITIGSVSSSGQFIAIAGKYGFAHYNTASGKWKLFGDEQQEKSFSVQAMVWFRSMVLVGCKDLHSQKYEIRAFSRETKLENMYILHKEAFSNEIIAMNITESHLLVFTADCIIRYYSLFVEDGKLG